MNNFLIIIKSTETNKVDNFLVSSNSKINALRNVSRKIEDELGETNFVVLNLIDMGEVTMNEVTWFNEQSIFS